MTPTGATTGSSHRFLGIPRTLRTRLILASGGSILAAVALFTIATVVLVSHELRGSLDKALRARAQEVAQLAVSAPAVLTDPGRSRVPLPPARLRSRWSMRTAV